MEMEVFLTLISFSSARRMLCSSLCRRSHSSSWTVKGGEVVFTTTTLLSTGLRNFLMPRFCTNQTARRLWSLCPIRIKCLICIVSWYLIKALVGTLLRATWNFAKSHLQLYVPPPCSRAAARLSPAPSPPLSACAPARPGTARCWAAGAGWSAACSLPANIL